MTQVALITGAARRIGAEIAKTLHAAGFDVIVHSHRHSSAQLCDELNEIRPNSATGLQANLLHQHERQQLIQQLPQLDVLVHNASVFYTDSSCDSTRIQEQMAINAIVPYEMSLECQSLLQQSAAPCIINIADVHASFPLTGYEHYCASKAALLSYSQQLAKHLAPKIRVNCVSPGAIMWPEHDNEMSEQQKAKIIEQTALKRSGAPSDIAKAVLMFTQMPFVTGQNLMVDGGRTLLRGQRC